MLRVKKTAFLVLFPLDTLHGVCYIWIMMRETTTKEREMEKDIYEGWLEYKIGKPVSDVVSFVDDTNREEDGSGRLEYARCCCSDGTYIVSSEIVPSDEWAPGMVVRQLVEIKRLTNFRG
jgi:hypothetical protein